MNTFPKYASFLWPRREGVKLIKRLQRKWMEEIKKKKKKANRSLSHVKNGKKAFGGVIVLSLREVRLQGGRGKTATFTICQQLPADAAWMQQVKSFKLRPGTEFAFLFFSSFLWDNLERLRFLVRRTQRASGWFLSQFISFWVYFL